MSVDISFDTGPHRLNVRAAVLIRHKGFLLCDREDGIEWSYLPGGRVKRGETSADAVRREMREELNADVKVRTPQFITESFYMSGTKRYHELAFYFVVDKPENFPFTPNQIAHTHVENGVSFFHSWVPLTVEGLKAAQLEPQALHQQFIDLPTEPVHVVINELV